MAQVAPDQEHERVKNDRDGVDIYHSFANSDSEANDPEVTFIASQIPSSAICYED